jgi:hypothetical protein
VVWSIFVWLEKTIIVLRPIGTSMPREACQANESVDWWADQRKNNVKESLLVAHTIVMSILGFCVKMILNLQSI